MTMTVEDDIKQILQRLSVVETLLSNHLKEITTKGERAARYKIALIATATALGIWVLTRLLGI